MKRILVLQNQRIGDLLQTTTLLAGLREKYAPCHITLLMNRMRADLNLGDLVDEVIQFDQNGMFGLLGDPGSSIIHKYDEVRRFLDPFRKRPFDLVIDVPVDTHMHLIASIVEQAGETRGVLLSPARNWRYTHPEVMLLYTIGLCREVNRFNLVDLQNLLAGVAPASKQLHLAVPAEAALALTDEIAFFQAVRARLLKFESNGDNGSKQNFETAIRQIVNQAVESTQVIDIFDAAGIKKPDISLLSEEFLQDVKDMKHKNLGLELLKKILNDEIKVRLKYNVVEGKKLLEMLEESIKKYQNNLLTTAEIIEELLVIARQIREVDGLADKLKLSKEEFAFYTALEVNDSAVKVLGDETLKTIAREIADKVRTNATIDWTLKESARAKLMVIVKRTLNKYGYPPDKQQKAIDTVMKQAEVLADYWVSG